MQPVRSHRGQLEHFRRSERSCVLARGGMVASSVPAASDAGVEMLRRGGNAVDAALAAAAMLSVAEPMSTGIGGDAFALLWSAREGRLVGLNGSGRAPAAATPEAYRARGLEAMPTHGILSVTVPGAVHAWETLSRSHGRLPLGEVLEPAVRAARDGFPVAEIVAHYWFLLERGGALRNAAARATFAPEGRAPRFGESFRNPGLARTLERIAEEGARGFYEGPVAEAIARTSEEEGGLLSPSDLAGVESSWVEPLTLDYRGVTVAELPPNGQGITALIALGILRELPPPPEDAEAESALAWHHRIEAVKLAFADRNTYVADPEHAHVPVEALLDPGYLRRRAALVGPKALPGAVPGLGRGDTVYLCAADADGNLVSFIQSLFMGFGSGIACGETGVLLQNRGAGFTLDPAHANCLAPRKRPFHTIIPGMLLRGGIPWMAFGIMGGDVQAQAHVAFVSNVVDHGLNPQEALDAARFRYLEGNRVVVERPGAPALEGGTLGERLAAWGHEVVQPAPIAAEQFGGGQAIAVEEGGVRVGGSDRRKDGCARGTLD